MEKALKKCWLEIPVHFPDMHLDEFVVMPNSVYGIIIIRNLVVSADALHQMTHGIKNL